MSTVCFERVVVNLQRSFRVGRTEHHHCRSDVATKLAEKIVNIWNRGERHISLYENFINTSKRELVLTRPTVLSASFVRRNWIAPSLHATWRKMIVKRFRSPRTIQNDVYFRKHSFIIQSRLNCDHRHRSFTNSGQWRKAEWLFFSGDL